MFLFSHSSFYYGIHFCTHICIDSSVIFPIIEEHRIEPFELREIQTVMDISALERFLQLTLNNEDQIFL